ncbi:MAG: Lrp/AsnC ligand binding domain-containing protein [Pseudomonadota bacterium]
MKPLPGELKTVETLLVAIPDIVSCDRVTGEDCFLARAYLPSIADLERPIDRILPHATTTTAIVQSQPVSSPAPCFDEQLAARGDGPDRPSAAEADFAVAVL